jgi:nucleoside-diphosphate-sugar epimerase
MNPRTAGITQPKSESSPADISEAAARNSFIVDPDDRILVTGAAGFIGPRVVNNLVDRGFRNLVCFVRPSSDLSRIEATLTHHSPGARVEVRQGNLLSRSDCEAACQDVALIIHLAAGTGEKSFPDAFLNSVVATRNLLEASLRSTHLRRFVLVSSFAVYTNRQNSRLLDESCPVEEHPELRGDAYCYAKVKQEQIVSDYGRTHGIPYVVVRPGSVYGAGKAELTGRVGVGTFGLFLHLGGLNTIPLTYVDNCAEAIVLAGLVNGIEGERFNIVDDDLPSSRRFLRLYKRNVRSFRSIYVPHVFSHALCCLWEQYSEWSDGQLPRAFNRRRWHAEWKKTRYSNQKLKSRLGWSSKVPTAEGLSRYFNCCTSVHTLHA